MKLQKKLNKTTIFEVEAETQKELFEAMSLAHEVFGEKQCGLCGSEDIVPVVRKVTKVTGKKVETFEYPEYHCTQCHARLALSYNLEGGTMFVNRRLLETGQPATGDNREKGKYGKHNGWTHYKGEPKNGEQPKE